MSYQAHPLTTSKVDSNFLSGQLAQSISAMSDHPFSDRIPAKFSGEEGESKVKFWGWLSTKGVLKVVSNAEGLKGGQLTGLR